jgi:hypothetical protein
VFDAQWGGRALITAGWGGRSRQQRNVSRRRGGNRC